MRDRPVIYAGLLVFLGLATFPLWRDLAAGVTTAGPRQQLPAHEKVCVAGSPYMKSSHMKLLLDMREQAVRQGNRTYVGLNGRTYTISLSNTCLKECHGSKTKFCDRCHDYAGVSPACWSCHLDAKETMTVAAAPAVGGSR
jgi:hypothetical protein